MSSLGEVIVEVEGRVLGWPGDVADKRATLTLLLILVELRKLREEFAPLVADHTAPSVEIAFPREGSTISPRAGCVPTESVGDIPCACGCGKMVGVRPAYSNPACRVRAKRKRDKTP